MPRRLPIFYSALLLTGVNLLLRMVSTSFQVYISGRIGAAGVGLLQLVMSVGMMAMTLGMAGIRTATMYLTAEELGRKHPGHVRQVLRSCFFYSIVCCGAVSVGLRQLAPWLAADWIGTPQVAGAIRLFACFLPVSCLCGVMTGYFTAANRIGTLAVVEIGEQLCSMGVTLLFLRFWAGDDPARACEAVILGSGCAGCLTLLTLAVLRCAERAPRGKPIAIRRRLLHIAVPLALADTLKAGISTTENLMVPRRLARYPGAEEPLALFGTVCGMVFPVLMFPAAILFGLAELLIPELARCAAADSRKRIRYLVKRSLRVSMLYGCCFCGLMYLLAGDLCMALYGSTEAGMYLRRYALLIPMLYCDTITDAMTKGLGQQKACVRYNIITSAMDVALLFLLLPRYGMDGYLFSFAVTHLLNFALSLRRLVRISRIRIRPGVVVRAGLCTAAAIFAAGFVVQPVLRGCAFIVVLGCLLFLLGVLRREDLTWLRSLVRQK